MANLMGTMVKALVKGKLHIGELNGLERFMLAQFGLPDRVPTMLAATNVEPALVDPKFNYKLLAESVNANLELFDMVCSRVHADVIMVPIWQGVMHIGTAELGTEFKISEDRVPYSIGYPIKTKEDIARIKLPEEPTGHFKMYLDILKEAQRRHPEMLMPLTLDGPWDLAMLLRGDDKLPLDMRLHKDYVETDDPDRKEKIRRRGDPDIYPMIMELTTELATRLFELTKQNGLPLLGSSIVDQYAASPIMSRQDFVKYVLPYIERVWTHHGKKISAGYPCASPALMQHILENDPPGIHQQVLWSNYIFHTTPEGLTLPEYDRPAMELAKKYKKSYAYILHGKFLRDASEQEIEEVVKRVCGMATEMRASISFSISSVPPGASLEKVNYTFKLVEEFGRY